MKALIYYFFSLIIATGLFFNANAAANAPKFYTEEQAHSVNKKLFNFKKETPKPDQSKVVMQDEKMLEDERSVVASSIGIGLFLTAILLGPTVFLMGLIASGFGFVYGIIGFSKARKKNDRRRKRRAMLGIYLSLLPLAVVYIGLIAFLASVN